MKKITLHVVKGSDVGTDEIPDLQLEGSGLEQWLQDASGGFLELNIQRHDSGRATVDSDAASLQQMLADHLPVPTSRPVSDIGLLFCRNWRLPQELSGRRLYGIMFDFQGIDPLFGTFADYGIPRQGCAIFLDALVGRPPAEVVFTCLHELGHVFNFAHDPTGTSFMSETISSSRRYQLNDCVNLNRATVGTYPTFEWDVLPGGANFSPSAASVGGLALQSEPVKIVLPRYSRQKPPLTMPSVKLTAALPKKTYLLGETVVLDLAVRPAGKIQRAAILPNLDVGHSSCRIWYENPIGERRLFQPVAQVCFEDSELVAISARRPLRHNPRISFGRSGATFNSVGTYRIWAEMVVAGPAKAHHLIQSEPIAFKVCLPKDAIQSDVSHVLSHPPIARFIAQRGGPLSDKDSERIEKLVEKHRGRPEIQHAQLALANDAFNAGRLVAAQTWLEDICVQQHSLLKTVRRLNEQIKARGSHTEISISGAHAKRGAPSAFFLLNRKEVNTS